MYDSTTGSPISSFATWTTAQTPTALYISNMTSPTAGPTATAQTTSIMVRLATLLASHNLPLLHHLQHPPPAQHVRLHDHQPHLRRPLHGAKSPSRVTVACGDALPDGVEVVLSVVVGLDEQTGAKSLRMIPSTMNDHGDGQGKGPREVHVAGQIPLVPASMEMVCAEDLRAAGLDGEGDNEMAEFRTQTVLALQHLWRVGRAVDVQWWTGSVAFLAACEEGEAAARARLAGRAWRGIHRVLGEAGRGNSEDEEELDVWDLKNGVTYQPNANESTEGDGRPPLPDSGIVQISSQEQCPTPPCIVVQVDELPRGAAIEWTSVGLANCSRIDLEEISLPRGLPSYKTQVAGMDSYTVWSKIATPERIWLVDYLLDHPENSPSGRREDRRLSMLQRA
ncbi:hypothetical protein H2199_003384 [Coniosporium tulheliwenetii]|uniref:Uncharacterized protein n=1 Tax=Coniosporium tulheliwenetii TaxID=3383036 RepID=A0ACC2ZCC0_9PEZI|nr:hypothetical protein H2199_003384 [Cladosporium sp. JES 115]